MSVYQKGTFFHYDFVYRGRRYYGSTGQKTRRAAETVERTRRLEAAIGNVGDKGELTIDEAASLYLDEKYPPGMQPNSKPDPRTANASARKDRGQMPSAKPSQSRGRGDLKRRLMIAVECVGKATLLKEIDEAVIVSAIARRRQMGKVPPSNATINRDLIGSTLRPLLNRARKGWKARSLSPIDWKEVRLKEPKGLICEFTDEERTAWLAQLDGEPRLALELLLLYGLRFGELFFTKDDLDASEARLHLRWRKAEDELSMPLQKQHARQLAALASVRAQGEPVFSLTYYQLRSRIAEAGKRANIKRRRLIHGTRHHAGTTMLRKTNNLKLTQKLLGHASIKSTMRYAHANEADLRTAIDAMSPNSPEQTLEKRGTV